MNYNGREILIGLEWLFLGFGFFMFGYGVSKIANDVDRPVRWPFAGRWLLSGILFALAIACIDAARIRFDSSQSLPYWNWTATSWPTFFVRVPAVVMLFWVVWRVRHGGLVQGKPTSQTDTWDGKTERRSGKDRRQSDRRLGDRRVMSVELLD